MYKTDTDIRIYKTNEIKYFLKMLGLYLYTLKTGHQSFNMLCIINKLTLQKKLQIFVTNNVFLDKNVKTQQQQNKNEITFQITKIRTTVNAL